MTKIRMALCVSALLVVCLGVLATTPVVSACGPGNQYPGCKQAEEPIEPDPIEDVTILDRLLTALARLFS